MKVAIIPARGGSKRIPRKNIKPFCGKPMLAWSIEAAQNSKCFDLIVVSTDDAEIAELAKSYGACVPFIRPEELSNDFVGTIPVIKHAIQELMTQGYVVDLACCLYATAPFVQPADLQNGLAQLSLGQSDYVFSVCRYPFPIQRALRVDAQDNRVSMFDPTAFHVRSQDLEEAWHDAGQFYWGQATAWLQEKVIFNAESSVVVLPRHRVQDIDTPEDWQQAELMFKVMQLSPQAQA